MRQPEKLSLWDRIFNLNRYHKSIHARGNETWYSTMYGQKIPNTDYNRNWVEYLVVDRVTGSEHIEKVYLD